MAAWWRAARPPGWFPGQNTVNPLTARQLNRACHTAAQMAEIGKPVSLRRDIGLMIEEKSDRPIQLIHGGADFG